MLLELEELSFCHNGLKLYRAGLSSGINSTGYISNFTRDVILSGIIGQDPSMLRDQLLYNCQLQADKKDPFTGAEPGKDHHEYPGVIIRGLSTQYNACDTTAWVLMGHLYYENLTGDKDLANLCRPNIKRGVEYILSHLTSDYLFREDPKFADADRFALKVTYWKDSFLPQRENGEPDYPVVYTLAHAQNLSGLSCAAKLLDSSELYQVADRMKEGLQKLYNPELKTFNIALDRSGPISAISSDSLNLLFFTEPEDITNQQILDIIDSSQILMTPAGFRTLDERVAKGMDDRYHADTIWPSEQATIHAGAKKHRLALKDYSPEITDGLLKIEEVSSRIKLFTQNSNSEVFVINEGQVQEAGCNPQLWTVEAKEYFARC